MDITRFDQLKDKILIVHHGKGIGGASKSISMIANRLYEEGKNVHVLFLFKSDAQTLFENIPSSTVPFPTYYFNHTSRWYRLYEFPKILLMFFSWFLTAVFIAPYYLLNIKPSNLYLNSSVLTDWSFTAKILGIPNIVHIREAIADGYFGIRNTIIQKLLNFSASEIIFLSKHNYQCLKTHESKSHIIHNYVKGKPSTQKLQRKYDLIYVGGEKEIKGIALLEKLLNEKFKYKICLLGYYSETFIAKYSNFPNLEIIGPVVNPLHYIAQSKILLFLATTPHFPRPIIEAMSLGTVPVSTNVLGIKEIINHNKDGYILKENTISDLIVAIDNLKSKDLKCIREAAFETFENRFGRQNEEKLINLILEC